MQRLCGGTRVGGRIILVVFLPGISDACAMLVAKRLLYQTLLKVLGKGKWLVGDIPLVCEGCYIKPTSRRTHIP
jgi:hypothetical protein